MRISLAILLLTCLIACKKAPESQEQIQTEPQRTLKIACIGDQVTLGKKKRTRKSRRKKRKETNLVTYPQQLQIVLGDNYIVETFAVRNATILKNGNQPIWEDATFQKAQAFQPDIVLINLGANDTKMSNWWKHGDEFTNDYMEMIETFQSINSKPRVLICRPLKAFDIVNGINDSIMVVDVLPIIDSVATWRDVQIVDLYGMLEHRQDLFPGYLHPDNTACRIIAEIIADAITSKVKPLPKRKE